ncbi:MAG: Ig-like domain-containing protein [Burkholderiaceae bacterium]
MSRLHTTPTLAALALACAALAGCGGGDAEPPPVPAAPAPAGSGPDTTPPTVTIASDVSTPAATGPVTFTFVFSEDVGISFDGTDVTVGGGTPGTFTRVSGTQATLVVTPTPGVGGTITVDVPAKSFTDLAGNANTAAASASMPYLATQTISFASPGNQTLGTAAPALSATATSGLPVTIASTTPSVCTVSGSTLTLVAAGSCSLTASQAGNASFAAAPPVTVTFTVGGGSAPAPLTFSSGFAGGNRTVEGGAFFSYSGSNQDGFNCSGDPAWCGSGSGGSGATSFFYSYYQTPTPATALYNGISVQAPGVTSISATGDTAGVQINGQTTVDFTFNNNPEWQASGTNNFGVILTLGKFYNIGTGGSTVPCNIKLLAVVTPLNNGAATAYSVPLSSFQIIQACNTSISTVSAALASSPVSEVAFQAAGGGAALPTVGGKTTGANFTVAAGGVYPTTLALTGGITFGVTSVATQVDFSTGFAGGNRTVEGGAFFSYSGSNQDSYSCSGDPAWCGSGSGGSGATSFYYSYYQTPTPATALYNGISVLAPGVTAISATGDTGGVQLSGQTTVNFTFNNNPEWQASGTNNFGVLLTLGKFYNIGTGGSTVPCNIKLLAVVTPTNNGAATEYAVPLSSFQVIQACNTSISTVSAALASSPVSEVAFQAAGGGAALPTVGGKTTGANFTVAAGGVYPTTLALTGGIAFKP